MFIYSYVYIFIRDLNWCSERLWDLHPCSYLKITWKCPLAIWPNFAGGFSLSKMFWVTFRSYLKSVYDSVSINDKAYWTIFGEITNYMVCISKKETHLVNPSCRSKFLCGFRDAEKVTDAGTWLNGGPWAVPLTMFFIEWIPQKQH